MPQPIVWHLLGEFSLHVSLFHRETNLKARLLSEGILGEKSKNPYAQARCRVHTLGLCPHGRLRQEVLEFATNVGYPVSITETKQKIATSRLHTKVYESLLKEN